MQNIYDTPIIGLALRHEIWFSLFFYDVNAVHVVIQASGYSLKCYTRIPVWWDFFIFLVGVGMGVGVEVVSISLVLLERLVSVLNLVCLVRRLSGSAYVIHLPKVMK